jgi:hypothetical protein
MTLAERFARVQKQVQEPVLSDELETFKALSFEDQCNSVVTFGKSHVGKKFLEIWHQEPRWLQWVLKTFEGSTKLDHLKLFHFVQVMLEQEESGMNPKIDPKCNAKPKAKAKSSSRLPYPEIPVENLISTEEDEELWDITSHQPAQHEEIEALQTRMLNVENALTEILTLLRPK